MVEQSIGQSVLRKEDLRFITGKGKYTDDINLRGQTYAVFVRSPFAHAKISGVDTSQAESEQGVVAVVLLPRESVSILHHLEADQFADRHL